MALLDAMESAGLEYSAAFNESAAVIMASIDGRLADLPGVAILSLAPGISNAMNGLVDSFLEQTPLLVFSGQHRGSESPFVVRQGFDLESLVAPATKWRARITSETDISRLLAKAVDTAMTSPCGPVYLEIPDDVATAEAPVSRFGTEELPATLSASALAPARRVAPMPEEADRVADRLAAATRPMLVLGGRRSAVQPDAVRAFAEAWRVPVFTTSRQKGLLDSTCPYFAGTFLNGRLERQLFERSDLVLLIDPVAFDFYNRPWCFDADAIAIVDPGFSDWQNPLCLQVVADPGEILGQLTGRAATSRSVWSPADVGGYRVWLRETLLATDGSSLTAASAVAAALDECPQDGYLVADAGFSKPLVALLSEPKAPNRYFASNALSTMGYAIPASVALRQAGAPSVLAFMGDGSLLMRATELMHCQSRGAPAVFVAIIDGSLTQIEIKQERRGLRPVGTALPPASCTEFARPLGIDGVDVHTAHDLREAVRAGMCSDTPVLVGAHVDPKPSRTVFELLRG